MSKRLSRLALIVATAGAFAVPGTAVANPSGNALEHRNANAPGGEVTKVDDTRPAGAGTGRKVG